MSPRLPRLTALQMVHALEKLGFTLARQSGSHRIYIDAKGKRVTVPYHTGRILHPKVVRSIMRDAGIDEDELSKLLGKQD